MCLAVSAAEAVQWCRPLSNLWGEQMSMKLIPVCHVSFGEDCDIQHPYVQIYVYLYICTMCAYFSTVNSDVLTDIA